MHSITKYKFYIKTWYPQFGCTMHIKISGKGLHIVMKYQLQKHLVQLNNRNKNYHRSNINVR